VVIFGNGYDSVNGDAALYILNVDGTLLKKINTKQTSCNGLSSPSVIDINNDGRADYAYAGDLKGNLWKFDLTGDDPADWGVAYGTADSPKPLIQIPGKPITSKPDVMRHCEAGVKVEGTCTGDNKFLSGFMVIFGTGKYLDEIDRSSTDTQSIFGIWDYGDRPEEYLGVFEKNAPSNQRQLSNQSENITLLEQTQKDARIVNGVYLRTLSQNIPDWTAECDGNGLKNPNPAANAGWYFDLPTPGERIIKDVMIRDGRIIYLTFTPNASPCSGGGDSMIHEADACSGGRLSYEAFDINGDRRIDQGDLIDIGLVDEEGNAIMVAPTGLKRPGLLHFPVILRMPDDQREMKIFSSSAGTTETLFETAEKRGLYYWIER
jgi:type IV pilus assembly protein PilY1